MLLLLLLLIAVVKIQDNKLRYILLACIGILFIHAMYCYVASIKTLDDDEDVVDVIIPVQPNTHVLAWTHNPLKIYNSHIKNETICSVNKMSNEIGELCVEIVGSSLQQIPPEERIIHYKYLDSNNKMSSTKHAYIYGHRKHDAPAPEHFEDPESSIAKYQSIGNVLLGRMFDDNESINDEIENMDEHFNKDNVMKTKKLYKKTKEMIKGGYVPKIKKFKNKHLNK